MRSVAKSVTWLTIFTAIAAVCTLIVLTALRSPVSGKVSRYTAEFSDVSGLYVGDDVRISGVQVGKVEAIRLDGRIAKVDFTAQTDHPLFTNTVAAVRYQTLIGQRYVELVQPAEPDSQLVNSGTIPLGQTIPSFDVAKLFNGFQPIFQTLDPAQFNLLGENLLRLIQGDESGIGPFLHHLDVISKLAVDRQAVITVMIRNLSAISQDLGGKSQQLFNLITELNDSLARFASVGEEFNASLDTQLPGLRTMTHLLQYTERTFDGTTVPLYDLVSRMWPQTPTIIAGLSLAPSLIQGMRNWLVDAQPAQPTFFCSNGEVELPGIGQVSFAQQNLVVCR
ncbi:mammalian cell entry protein [Mycolicibacterium moriokaense]|jgi:phospholipid/cholesterol/gamma-HCH transport system substrate-binding protein|uniref:Mce family protein n=1 Tax=Mycolicibacterium moriokaense TaxID=39691 RepID=A0AAD1HF67_9MYCO|nr:MlaD family protein [Mycolicibacterium moriokaense]MCV7039361.1 MCE family protein [Mycolicibacterium moriokaense]ORB26809.1 mammalian cell entry protein [Mycolicibacterium moriokaense]BBX03884.1 putative Mce family protein [Mycolicibacterium moriokaense]